MSENAGEYNRAISIEKRSGAVDSSNQLLDDWEVVHALLWAKIKTESGMATIRRSAENQGIMVAPTRMSVRIRYRTDINEGMRVVRKGVPYDILRVQPDEAGREYVDLVCEAGGNDG